MGAADQALLDAVSQIDAAPLTQLYGGEISRAAAQVPTGTIGRAEDFGAVVAFLCSNQARFITGTSLVVDGGVLAKGN